MYSLSISTKKVPTQAYAYTYIHIYKKKKIINK